MEKESMPKVHEWKTQTIWKEGLNEQLQKLELEGWEIHQFYGNVMFSGDVIGVTVVLKRPSSLTHKATGA
jgi:hypothetical protein